MAENDYRKDCIIDIFDYSGNKVCPLYDSSADISGQAANIVVKRSRNDWKELSFVLPSMCQDAELGDVKNYRLDYLKSDYRIRLIDDNGTDWYIISQTNVAHKAFSQDVTVTAGHVAQLLKNKNLNLQFSDKEGNNIGTASQLLATILKGTGWTVGDVEPFYEKDGTTIKVRSLKCPTRTGAFKMIATMCDLFEAKPIYDGETRTVSIVHMNPFSKSREGAPDVTSADGVLELHYGKNLSSVTRKLNTENIATKLHVYGAYGQKSTGMCSINECEHRENVLMLLQALVPNKTYYFNIPDLQGTIRYRHFTPDIYVSSGTKLIWSELDPASLMYLWDETNKKAYPLQENMQGEALVYSLSSTQVRNWYDFLQDYTYYRKIGLMTDPMIQALGEYQREYPQINENIYTASTKLVEQEQKLSQMIGSVDFCRLNVDRVGTSGAYVTLSLNQNKRVLYRSDYNEKEDNYFEWYKADKINGDGDPIDSRGDASNIVASVIYIIHNTTPITWDKVFIKEMNNTEHPNQSDLLTLWMPSNGVLPTKDDRYYLFKINNINGGLGGVQLGNEASNITVRSNVRRGTVDHPVYYTNTTPAITDDLNGHGWLWKYNNDESPSQFYFCYTTQQDTVWHPVYYQKEKPPASSVQWCYWFDWSGPHLYRKSGAIGVDKWEELNSPDDKLIISDFTKVYKSCMLRDKLRVGYYDEYVYTVPDSSVMFKGNYYFELKYNDYILFTAEDGLTPGDKIVYNTKRNDVTTVINGYEKLVNSTVKQYDQVQYLQERPGVILYDHDTQYWPIDKSQIVQSGNKKGLWPYIRQFPDLMDDVFLDKLPALRDAQMTQQNLDTAMAIYFGDIYREGFWQKSDYVDGDEDKLYDDALEIIEKISHPQAEYTIGYLDDYHANYNAEYAASDKTLDIDPFTITTKTAAHLIDEEIDVNTWGYIDEINDCKDQPWKSSIKINTNLTTITQHSFTDVLTTIANVANELNGKTTLYDRVDIISGRRSLATQRLEGALDAAKLKIFGGSSTWMTDENGNMIFLSADGQSAMTLTGNGLAISDGKDKDGNWNWRTAATGQGIVADAITTGYLSAERIEAETITASKLAPNVGDTLQIGGNQAIIKINDDIGRIESSIEHFGRTYIQDTDPHIDEATGQPRIIYYGDYWIRTKGQKWKDVKENIWQEVKNTIWWEWVKQVDHYVWTGDATWNPETDSDKWLSVNDNNTLTYIGTKISQTMSEIALEASKRTALGQELRSSIFVNAQSIRLENKQRTQMGDELQAHIEITAEKIQNQVSRATASEGTLSSRITQTADAITSEVTRATEREGILTSRIKQTAEAITTQVQRASEAEGVLSSTITQTADAIKSEVKRASEAEGVLSSSVTQTAESIRNEVKRATEAEGELSSAITQTATDITAAVEEVEKGAYKKVSQVKIDTEGIHLLASAGSASTVDITPTKIDMKTGQFIVSADKVILNTNVTLQSELNKMVSTVTTEFNISTSSLQFTQFTGYSWSTTAQVVPTGGFLWQRTKVAKGTGTPTITALVCVSAVKGDPGKDGTNGTNGTDGNGITKIQTRFTVSNSSTQPTVTWANASTTYRAPSITQRYAWTMTATSYTAKATEYSNWILSSVYGEKGDKGDPGSPGSPGAKGQQGIGIKSVVDYFAISNSNSTAPTTGWQTSVPQYNSAKPWYWLKTLITFTDNTTTYTTPVLDYGTHDAVATAYTAKQSADDIISGSKKAYYAQLVTNDGVSIDTQGVHLSSSSALDLASAGRITIASNVSGQSGNAIEMSGSGIAIASGGNVWIKSGGKLQIDSGNFKIDNKGNVSVTGTIEAQSGTIAGWTIGQKWMYYGTGSNCITLNTGGGNATTQLYSMWVGAEYPQAAEKGSSGYAPFRIKKDGTVYVTKLMSVGQDGKASAIDLGAQLWKLNYHVITNASKDSITLSNGQTFNTAASVKLSGSWGGRTYTATASNGQTLTTTVQLPEVTIGSLYANNRLGITINLKNENGDLLSTVVSTYDISDQIESQFTQHTEDVYTISNDTYKNTSLFVQQGSGFQSVGSGFVRVAYQTNSWYTRS